MYQLCLARAVSAGQEHLFGNGTPFRAAWRCCVSSGLSYPRDSVRSAVETAYNKQMAREAVRRGGASSQAEREENEKERAEIDGASGRRATRKKNPTRKYCTARMCLGNANQTLSPVPSAKDAEREALYAPWRLGQSEAVLWPFLCT